MFVKLLFFSGSCIKFAKKWLGIFLIGYFNYRKQFRNTRLPTLIAKGHNYDVQPSVTFLLLLLFLRYPFSYPANEALALVLFFSFHMSMKTLNHMKTQTFWWVFAHWLILRDNIWHFVVATLETKRFQDDAHYKKDVFYRKKIYDDNDDDDVDDDVDYEEIAASLIHNLSIVFLSRLRTIEMYIKKPADF